MLFIDGLRLSEKLAAPLAVTQSRIHARDEGRQASGGGHTHSEGQDWRGRLNT